MLIPLLGRSLYKILEAKRSCVGRVDIGSKLMAVESQAILSGHISVEQVVRLLKLEVTGPIKVRDMHQPEYKMVEYRKVDGSWSSLNLFLNSYAADDYADAFKGPSTFLTTEYSPQNFNLVRLIAAAVGGLARKTGADAWIELAPAQT